MFSFDLVLRTAWTRNVGNVVTTEVMVVVAFLLHRRFTWAGRERGFWRPLLSFHLVTGVGMVGRFVVFALVDALGAGPMIATLVSIPAAVVVNYLGYDRIVFKRRQAEREP